MIPDWFAPVTEHLARGLFVTLWISLLTVTLATLLGVLVGATSASAFVPTRLASRAFVEFFRGIPSLITLLFVFFALPQIGVQTSPITAATLGLGVWGAANIAETFRGAIESIPLRQALSARALGMSARQALIYVVAPQALRRFLPPYVGQITVLIQASALTSVVGVSDLLTSARQMIERLAYISPGHHAIAIYGMVLVAFFVICYSLTLLSQYLERRLRV